MTARVSTGLALLAAVIAAVAIALIAQPELRGALITLASDPRLREALPADARVRFEPAARACAEEASRLLPAAMARIEAAHGRAFAQPPLVALYADDDAYARANGLGAAIAGVTRNLPGDGAAALLSPTLCGGERARLDGVMTHELSHVHFAGWRKRGGARPPAWFTEGLAVMASDGGGAEGVSDDEARQALRDGVAVILDARPWHDFGALAFLREPQPPPQMDGLIYRQRLAFRQAGVFVGWLRARDAGAFAQLLRRLEQGDPLDAAAIEIYGAATGPLWRDFIATLR